MLDQSDISQEDNPQAVEKIFQKYENEIRSHIKMEREYQDLAIQNEKSFKSVKKICDDQKDQIEQMGKQINDLQDELGKYKRANAKLK